MLLPAIEHCLDGFSSLLRQLTPARYALPCAALGGASIGEHLRHSIEMFQMLFDRYESREIDYDARPRNPRLQSDPVFALEQIASIRKNLDRPDVPLTLLWEAGGKPLRIESNYRRELLYNLEHCIHHQALIKVALTEDPDGIALPPDFGVARSTLTYRSACAR